MEKNRKRTRLIRERMKRTGEPYNVARRAVEAEQVIKADKKETDG